MQILILGNGFDRSSGLPTSYEEFFEWRVDEIEKKYKSVRELLLMYINYFYKSITFVEVPFGEKSKLQRTPCVHIDGKRTPFTVICTNIRKLMIDLKNEDINFFDLYFMLNKLEKSEWYFIELEIYNIVKKIDTFNKTVQEKMNDITSLIPLRGEYIAKDEKSANVIHECLFTIFLEQCKEDGLNTYEILLKELKAFEAEFKKYINEVISKVESSAGFKRIYNENCKKLVKFEEYTYIINFNYTSVTGIIESKSTGPKEINVHGRYDKLTIFGIDQENCNTENDEYMFSKTYRKISENTDSLLLPYKKDKNQENQEIVFYGHSLSKADYSYFISLFDLYDIYNQTFLTFKYSIYDEKKSYQIKKEIFKNVVKLLTEYGEKMDNKDHGRNLLHKILLEGRLKIEEVALEKMEYK